MIWNSAGAVALRNVGRKIGFNQMISVWLAKGSYEDRFGHALEKEIRKEDRVWDVGANVGLYSKKFAEQVGPKGHVVAFEPVSSCFSALLENLDDIENLNIKAFNLALGDRDGKVRMTTNEHPLAPINHILADESMGGMSVDMRSSDSFLRENPHLLPNVVKIDVEGFEGAVIDGMAKLLPNAQLRCLGIEIHFGLLAERGESAQPRKIQATLRKHGFQVNWTDPSHLLAVR